MCKQLIYTFLDFFNNAYDTLAGTHFLTDYLTILEKNGQAKKSVLIELSLFFEPDSVLIIERDSGILFDLTDADNQIHGLSGFILSGLMEAHQEKAYLVTTGYNRNMIRFSQN